MEASKFQLPELTDDKLKQIVERLVRALSPRRIYLFGSRAYGQPHANSDIDLLIVVENASRLTIDDMKRAHACLRGSFMPFELHFRSTDNFERRSRIRTSLEHHVATRGRLLYAA